MNDKAKFAVNLLREYAKEHGTTVRGTSDLSPLEQWLIMQLYEKDRNREIRYFRLADSVKKDSEK